MSRSKQKGTAAETAIVRYLNDNGQVAVRNPPQGANDKGDINVLGISVVIEVKNCVKMELSEWIKEAITERDNAKARVGAVWHKKRGTTDPGKWYVTLNGEDFVKMLDAMRRY